MTRTLPATYVSSFESLAPRHSASQPELLRFLAETHAAAALANGECLDAARLVTAYGAGETVISRRAFECDDVFLPPEQRRLYRVSASQAEGASIADRAHFFGERAREVAATLVTAEPAHLIHVTCTGYVSPSAAQLLVAERGWNSAVTHAYHMGCYASLPALRIALGQVAAFGSAVELLHTEMCSLHMNPADHSPEQLVVQSLFGDGHIRYSVGAQARGPCFRVLTLREQILPGTAELMAWSPAPWGMQMQLSREVPARIRDGVREFLRALLEQANLPLDAVLKHGLFAIHPGGPKILDSVKESLELREEQIAQSRQVLFERGNMSSATVPHIWQGILRSEPAAGTIVVSLAFGPGLTMFGAVFEVAS